MNLKKAKVYWMRDILGRRDILFAFAPQKGRQADYMPLMFITDAEKVSLEGPGTEQRCAEIEAVLNTGDSNKIHDCLDRLPNRVVNHFKKGEA